MDLGIEQIVLFLFVASVVALATKRLRVPYTVGLVVAGIALAVVPFFDEVMLSKDLIFKIFLPALIFEAALYIRWDELRRDFWVVTTFATIGVVLAAAVTAAGMFYLAHWQWQSALIFGVLIAATDPVSVIAAFKEAKVQGRLRLLMEAESLFNDSTAAVGFAVVVALAAGQSMGVTDISWMLMMTIGGGILCGAVVAGGLLVLAGRTDDHLIEMTFTMVAAYGSFLLAEHFHLSGVLATLTAGLIVGNFGSLGSFSDVGREKVEAFWDYMAFVSNSLIFLLIGIRESHEDFSDMLMPLAIGIVVVTLGRAVAIYPCAALFARGERRVKAAHQHILFWGGLRGALALALALGLPDDLPQRSDIVTVTFGVVAFSVFVQGLTMKPLLTPLC